MIGVFDASVLVKLFLNEVDSGAAVAVVHHFGTIFTLDISRAEVTSAITRSYRNGTIPLEEATLQLERWQQFRLLGNVRFASFDELLDDAAQLSLKLKHPLMDCFYLALSERERVPLITSDEPFLKAAESQANVRHLRDFLN